MTQLTQRLSLDLADTLARYREGLTDFLQRMFTAIFQPEAHLDALLLARRERAQHLRSLVFEVDVDHSLSWRDHCTVFNEVAQMRIFLFADGCLQRNRFLSDLQHLAHFGYRNIHALSNFFRRGFASQLLHQLPRGADQLVDGLNHVDRDANRTRLISNCTSNRLPNPPRGISGTLIPAAIFEFVHCLHQTDIALLDQIQELQTSVGVFLGDRNHEPEVSLDELALGMLRIHVSLDNFALGALEFGKRDSGFGLQFLE